MHDQDGLPAVVSTVFCDCANYIFDLSTLVVSSHHYQRHPKVFCLMADDLCYTICISSAFHDCHLECSLQKQNSPQDHTLQCLLRCADQECWDWLGRRIGGRHVECITMHAACLHMHAKQHRRLQAVCCNVTPAASPQLVHKYVQTVPGPNCVLDRPVSR